MSSIAESVLVRRLSPSYLGTFESLGPSRTSDRSRTINLVVLHCMTLVTIFLHLVFVEQAPNLSLSLFHGQPG